MAKRLVVLALFTLWLCASVAIGSSRAIAGSSFGEGFIDKELRYEGFEVSEEGILRGYLVNTSARTRPAFTVDMWTTNAQETRIFWRKSLHIGDLPPGGRYVVQEPYSLDGENPARIKFMFRLPHKDNFRNRAK